MLLSFLQPTWIKWELENLKPPVKDSRAIEFKEPGSLNAGMENWPTHNHIAQGDQLTFQHLYVIATSRIYSD